MSDAVAIAEFYTELAARDAELEAAKAGEASDQETYERVTREYAEWRRDLKILAGRRGWEKALAVKEGRDVTEGAIGVASDATVEGD